jgi:hypothetical protein
MIGFQGRPNVRWKLELSGEPEELKGLAKMFPPRRQPGIQVWFEEDKCYLHAAEFEEMTDGAAVHERGCRWVARLNALGLLKFGGFRPIEGGAVLKPSSDGGHGTWIFPGPAVIYLPASSLLSYIGEQVPPLVPQLGPDASTDPIVPPVEQWINAPDRCAPDLDDALDLLTLGVQARDWRLLYIVYEIIEHHMGEPLRMEQLGWGSAAEVKRFKATANSRPVLGTKARHGRSKRDAPDNPMTFREARTLIQALLLAWVRSLAQ